MSRTILQRQIEYSTGRISDSLYRIHEHYPITFDIEFEFYIRTILEEDYETLVETRKIETWIEVRATNPIFIGPKKKFSTHEVPIIFNYLRETGKIQYKIDYALSLLAAKEEHYNKEIQKLQDFKVYMHDMLKLEL